MPNRKAQKSGSQAGVVIALVTIVLVAYILFLPPEEREDLLDSENGYYGSISEDDNLSLINVTSLRLEYVGEDEYEHSIPNIYLFESTGAEVLDTFNPFYIRNGWFDKKTHNISFYITDLGNTGNVALSFEAPEAK